MSDWEAHVRAWIEAWCGKAVWAVEGGSPEAVNTALDTIGSLLSDTAESIGLHPSEADYTQSDFVDWWCGMQYLAPKSFLEIKPDDVVIGAQSSRKAAVFFTMRGEVSQGPPHAKHGSTIAASGSAELRFAEDGKVDRIRQWFDQRVLEAQTGLTDAELRKLGQQHGRATLRPD